MMIVRVGQMKAEVKQIKKFISIRILHCSEENKTKSEQKWSDKVRMVMIKLDDMSKITLKSVHNFHCVFSANYQPYRPFSKLP